MRLMDPNTTRKHHHPEELLLLDAAQSDRVRGNIVSFTEFYSFVLYYTGM